MFTTSSDENIKVLYLNLIVNDEPTKVAKAKDDTATAKDETKNTKGLKSRVAHKVTKLAPPGLVAQMMGSMVCRKLPKRMLKKGITVEVKEIFREATYVVLQMRVVHVDSVLFAKKRSKKRRKKGKKSTNSNNWINSFWNMVGEDYQKRFEEDYLPKLVKNRLAAELPPMLEKELASKRVSAEAKLLNEEEQSAYFDAKVKEVREKLKINRQKNPIRWIRQRKPLQPVLDN